MATQTTHPSYGYWIEHGFTTLCETWRGAASHNHQMFGSIDEFFFKYLAGIQAPTDGTTSKAYKFIVIKPYIPQGLASVDASLLTAAGNVESHWKQSEGTIQLKVVIPANSEAAISIPVQDYKNIFLSESGKTVWENGAFVPGVPGLTGATQDGNSINLSAGSGTYYFVLTGK
jgi:alpha-L-rhamnosidase